MKSKKSMLKEVNELTQGKNWLTVARIFGMAALAIALDFRNMYRWSHFGGDPLPKEED